MTILAPSKKSNEARGRRHKTGIDWTILAVRVISRWLKRSFVLIGDGGFACIRLGHACLKQKVTLVSRLRLDSALYEEVSFEETRAHLGIETQRQWSDKAIARTNTMSYGIVLVSVPVCH